MSTTPPSSPRLVDGQRIAIALHDRLSCFVRGAHGPGFVETDRPGLAFHLDRPQRNVPHRQAKGRQQRLAGLTLLKAQPIPAAARPFSPTC